MLRIIAGVVVGCIVMFAIVAISLVAAIVGGLAGRAIGKSPNATIGLAALVLVLGVLSATQQLKPSPDAPTTRAADVGNFEAMNCARQPGWVALSMPVSGVVGVLIGGQLAGRPSKPAPSA
jgi:hypothetical protein